MPTSGELRLHHFGFVVSDIVAVVDGFVRSLNATWDGKIYEDPNQKVKVTFITVTAQEAQMELVEPVGEDSPVARFLRERGGGLHHVCYEVPDLEQQMNAMRDLRAMIIKKPKPAVAFAGRRIAWLMTQEKLLIELLEAERAAAAT